MSDRYMAHPSEHHMWPTAYAIARDSGRVVEPPRFADWYVRERRTSNVREALVEYVDDSAL